MNVKEETRNGYECISGVGLYKFHTKAVEWNRTKLICDKEGGHLATIDSEEEALVSILFKFTTVSKPFRQNFSQ